MNGANERHRQEARARQGRVNARKRTGRKPHQDEIVAYHEWKPALRRCSVCERTAFARACEYCGHVAF